MTEMTDDGAGPDIICMVRACAPSIHSMHPPHGNYNGIPLVLLYTTTSYIYIFICRIITHSLSMRTGRTPRHPWLAIVQTWAFCGQPRCVRMCRA